MARVRPANEKAAGIFEVLHLEHADVTALFEQIEAALDDAADETTDLFTVLADSLLAHAKAEEAVVYPRFARIDAIADRMNRSEQEHAEIARQLEDLRGSAPNGEAWLAKLKTLQEEVRRHVKEEEDVIFDVAMEDLDAEESRQLAEKFRQARALRTGGPKAAPVRRARIRTRAQSHGRN